MGSRMHSQAGRYPGPSRILVFDSVHLTPQNTHPVSLAGLILGPTLPHLHPAALTVPWAPCQFELRPCSLLTLSSHFPSALVAGDRMGCLGMLSAGPCPSLLGGSPLHPLLQQHMHILLSGHPPGPFPLLLAVALCGPVCHVAYSASASGSPTNKFHEYGKCVLKIKQLAHMPTILALRRLKQEDRYEFDKTSK